MKKPNGGRRPEEILAEIEDTRSDMDSTLSAIEQRLTPGQLVDQGLDYLRHSGANEFVSNLGGSVKGNPMPVALVGIGLAWLMASGRNHGSQSTQSWSSESGSRLSETAGSAKDRLGQASGSAKERLGQAKQSLSETAQSAREKLSSTTDSARQQFKRARGGYEWMLREQPLALGAIGVAIGAMLAAAAPRTRKEDELMGESRDRLAEQAKEAGKQQLEKAQDVAKSAAQAAGNEAQRQGMAKPAKSAPPQAAASGQKPEPPGHGFPTGQPPRPR